MKIEDYVRTEFGEIGKIIQFSEYNLVVQVKSKIIFIEKNCLYYKSSSNIMDLIEKNDLVKIEYYAERYKERITRVFVVDYVIKKDICFANSHCQFNIFDGEWSKHDKKLKPIIKSIVTREQFSQMEYKVGD